jgi:hypothetical protein
VECYKNGFFPDSVISDLHLALVKYCWDSSCFCVSIMQLTSNCISYFVGWDSDVVSVSPSVKLCIAIRLFICDLVPDIHHQ